MKYGVNCDAVEDHEQLANAVLERKQNLDYRETLENVSPKRVIPKWIEAING